MGADQRLCRKNELFELAGDIVRAAPKEKKMKRTISLWLGLLAFALLPALAQEPSTATNGKIHNEMLNVMRRLGRRPRERAVRR